jgi:DNA mismatch repair protein MutS
VAEPYHNLKIENFTPVMQQYLTERKKLTGKSVLLFRMGDFYEAFFQDAEDIAQELEITLTGRPESNYPGGRLPMAGVPQKAVKGYIARLLDRDYKVYIAEQMADPKTCKGLVPRSIVKIFTSGTINDLDLLESYRNNFIAAICPEKFKDESDTYGLAYADISTGEFYATELSAKFLEEELARIQAAEIIAPSSRVKEEGMIVAEEKVQIDVSSFNLKKELSPFNKENFDIDLARQNLSSVFEINSVDKLVKESFAPDSKGLALKAAGALIEYFKETLSSEFAQNSSKNFDVIKTYTVSEFMLLDKATRKNLELTESTTGNKRTSLFATIDKTASKPGRRRLQNWLEQPLFDLAVVNARQEAVTEFIISNDERLSIQALLKRTYDIDRLSGRLASTLISPRELNNLKDSLLAVVEISSLLDQFKSPIISSLKYIPDSILSFCREVESAVKPDPSLAITDGGILNVGYNQELDEYISLVEDSESWLKNYENEQRGKLGIKNLKVSFNKIHGYFLETSRANESKITDDYVVKQTMVNTVRFMSEDLQSFEEKITNAESRRNGLEYKIYNELRRTLAGQSSLIKQIANATADLDAIQALAQLAVDQDFVRPELNDSLDLEIIQGRHPVVEANLSMGAFVPNDLKDTQIMILTGPNMAGKSTYMRQNALIILLAQIGSYVPAESARIGLVDRIFTRIGASDDLSSGQSTFMVEMTEAASILNSMTEKSFVILDEIGRGTSTYDGVAIAWSILEYIAKTFAPRTIFATHYHELANLARIFNSIKNYQVLVAENPNARGKNKIEFLHKVAPGSADKSYGIEVAKLAGLPKEVIQRATAINNQLQAQRKQKLGLNSKNMDSVKSAINQDGDLEIDKLPLFST